jgi:hypothetical protein
LIRETLDAVFLAKEWFRIELRSKDAKDILAKYTQTSKQGEIIEEQG